MVIFDYLLILWRLPNCLFIAQVQSSIIFKHFPLSRSSGLQNPVWITLMLKWYTDGWLITWQNLLSCGNVLTVGISAIFGVTVRIAPFDDALPARLAASQWYTLEFCSFWTERRTRYEMLPFWIVVEFERSVLLLSQLISGGGEPVAPQLKVTSFPSSSSTSSGWIEKTGFQITVV